MGRIIVITLGIFSIAGCTLGAQERRGAAQTTEAQIPPSPELYTEAEFEEASAAITRYQKENEASQKKSEAPRHVNP